MLKYKEQKVINCSEWDGLVQKTYGRPYCFQQQEGCQDRGIRHITIPSDWDEDEDMNDSIKEEVNGGEMGVKFAVWLARDPKQPLMGEKDNDKGMIDFHIDLFWSRNFYPDLQTVANDLHKKGLVEAGDYIINIDW